MRKHEEGTHCSIGSVTSVGTGGDADVVARGGPSTAKNGMVSKRISLAFVLTIQIALEAVLGSCASLLSKAASGLSRGNQSHDQHGEKFHVSHRLGVSYVGVSSRLARVVVCVARDESECFSGSQSCGALFCLLSPELIQRSIAPFNL